MCLSVLTNINIPEKGHSKLSAPPKLIGSPSEGSFALRYSGILVCL